MWQWENSLNMFKHSWMLLCNLWIVWLLLFLLCCIILKYSKRDKFLMIGLCVKYYDIKSSSLLGQKICNWSQFLLIRVIQHVYSSLQFIYYSVNFYMVTSCDYSVQLKSKTVRIRYCKNKSVSCERAQILTYVNKWLAK